MSRDARQLARGKRQPTTDELQVGSCVSQVASYPPQATKLLIYELEDAKPHRSWKATPIATGQSEISRGLDAACARVASDELQD